ADGLDPDLLHHGELTAGADERVCRVAGAETSLARGTEAAGGVLTELSRPAPRQRGAHGVGVGERGETDDDDHCCLRRWWTAGAGARGARAWWRRSGWPGR